MKSFLFLILTILVSSAQWNEVANIDHDLEQLIASDTHLVAYTSNKVSASTDGLTWSAPIDPGFPILEITRTPSGNLAALGYALESSSRNPSRPYSLLIMDSTDGINWTQRIEIVFFEGFALPISGEIAVTETHFHLAITTNLFGFPENMSFYGNNSIIEEDHFGHTGTLALDGDFFGKGPDFSNRPCTFTDTLPSTESDPRFASWRNLNGFLDLRTTSDDLLIGQNGISRKNGIIYYGNWKNLGEIKGYHNGVGLILTESRTSPKLYLSHDFLRTWTEQDLSEFNPDGYLDATFFKNQWFVLADSNPTNHIYSFPVAPVTYQSLGPAQVKTITHHDRSFIIPGCKDNLTTNIEIQFTFPDEADKLYQLYSSYDLETWTAYGLPFPGATTYNYPLVYGLWDHLRAPWNYQKIFFRAEEISVQSQPGQRFTRQR